MKHYFVYIMSSKSRTLYTGITDNLITCYAVYMNTKTRQYQDLLRSIMLTVSSITKSLMTLLLRFIEKNKLRDGLERKKRP